MDGEAKQHPMKAEYEAVILERLQLDPDPDPRGPLIDLKDVSILGGLAKGTPGMARQRTARGIARVPFPDPDPNEGSRWEDKPLWRAFDILDYFRETDNWPVGSAARPKQRHKRPGPKTPASAADEKVTWTRLGEINPELADKIRDARLNDGARRSVAQWAHRYAHTSGHRHEVIHRTP